MKRLVAIVLVICGTALCSGCSEGDLRAASAPTDPLRERQFGDIVAKLRGMTYQQLAERTPRREYLERLSFDPGKVDFFYEAGEMLQLDDAGRAMLRRQGFVSTSPGRRDGTFGSLYYKIYTKDLPVLVTTDSVLHALHRSYDELLKELEETFFTSALDEALGQTHELLAATAPSWGGTRQNYEDVDLYLTVARNLLCSAGAPAGERLSAEQDLWNGEILLGSMLGQNEEAVAILKLIQSHRLQTEDDEFTDIYGGERRVDYSQFKPRGHYVKSSALSRYFRTMMWLGRSDTGWNLLPPDPEAGIACDAEREAGDAMLLARLLEASGGARRLRQMSDIMDFLVGESDCLTPTEMTRLLDDLEMSDATSVSSGSNVARFQQVLASTEAGTQRIASQVIDSDPMSLHQVEPPRLFQLFGQRFVVDSFVLSKVVYDSIIFKDKKVKRWMPTGLDVMFALGNDAALPLLQAGMEDFPYAANLLACREFVDQYSADFWRSNLYNIWLDALRTADEDLSAEPHAPEAMRTEAWQHKQLQTQLASWSELRHNTLLYAKQSYTMMASCEYPAGYVEPYPETYARIKLFAEEAARRIEAADYTLTNGDHAKVKQRQIEFLKKMADTVGRLETLARKELAAEPFSEEERQWMKTLIEAKPFGCTGPTYSGWYGDLFYGGGRISSEFDPTIVDVHTDPNAREVLEEGVGACTLVAVAIDNEDDRMIYVGPTYSYYEFRQPAEQRLTDMAWAEMLRDAKNTPPRPAWTASFCAPQPKHEAN